MEYKMMTITLLSLLCTYPYPLVDADANVRKRKRKRKRKRQRTTQDDMTHDTPKRLLLSTWHMAHTTWHPESLGP